MKLSLIWRNDNIARVVIFEEWPLQKKNYLTNFSTKVLITFLVQYKIIFNLAQQRNCRVIISGNWLLQSPMIFLYCNGQIFFDHNSKFAETFFGIVSNYH